MHRNCAASTNKLVQFSIRQIFWPLLGSLYFYQETAFDTVNKDLPGRQQN